MRTWLCRLAIHHPIVQSQTFRFDDGEIVQHMRCHKCGKEWDRVTSLIW